MGNRQLGEKNVILGSCIFYYIHYSGRIWIWWNSRRRHYNRDVVILDFSHHVCYQLDQWIAAQNEEIDQDLSVIFQQRWILGSWKSIGIVLSDTSNTMLSSKYA